MSLVVPCYWRNETSGVLRPAVEAYLEGFELSGGQLAAIRAYLRQWIAGDFLGVERLRQKVDLITDKDRLADWLAEAERLCIDPF